MTDTAVARHYFDDLATQNDAVSSTFDGPVPTGLELQSMALNAFHSTALCPSTWPAMVAVQTRRWRCLSEAATRDIYSIGSWLAGSRQRQTSSRCIKSRSGHLLVPGIGTYIIFACPNRRVL